MKAGGVAIGLGTAGGLLIRGIIIGYAGSLNPTFGRVPSAARYLLKQLGLMLLMASIGLNAGGGILEGLTSLGPAILLSALAVASIPLLVGYLVGRKVLKLNPALLPGSLTGAMTSTPALAVVTDAATFRPMDSLISDPAESSGCCEAWRSLLRSGLSS